jgi:hypothetical protein
MGTACKNYLVKLVKLVFNFTADMGVGVAMEVYPPG